MSWMDGRASDPDQWGGTGHFLTGWPDQIWILHAMWENPSIPDAITYAEADKILSDLGERPRIVTEVDELEPNGILSGEVQLGFDTGGGWGLTFPLEPPWVRLSWRDYMDRNGLHPDPDYIPCSRWIGWDFRTNIEPPGEGSLDLVQLSILESLLLEHEMDRDPRSRPFVHAWMSFHSPVECIRTGPGEELPLDGRLFHGPLDELASFSIDEGSSPNNIWPDDHSWFVTTDVDAWGTLVQGPSQLIDRIRLSTGAPAAHGQRPTASFLDVHETFESRLTPSPPRSST